MMPDCPRYVPRRGQPVCPSHARQRQMQFAQHHPADVGVQHQPHVAHRRGFQHLPPGRWGRHQRILRMDDVVHARIQGGAGDGRRGFGRLHVAEEGRAVGHALVQPVLAPAEHPGGPRPPVRAAQRHHARHARLRMPPSVQPDAGHQAAHAVPHHQGALSGEHPVHGQQRRVHFRPVFLQRTARRTPGVAIHPREAAPDQQPPQHHPHSGMQVRAVDEDYGRQQRKTRWRAAPPEPPQVEIQGRGDHDQQDAGEGHDNAPREIGEAVRRRRRPRGVAGLVVEQQVRSAGDQEHRKQHREHHHRTEPSPRGVRSPACAPEARSRAGRSA